MKSIGIVTIHNSQNNYGGVLQSYALYHYLETLGYCVEIIDLHRPNNKDFVFSYKYPMIRQRVGIRTKVKGFFYHCLGRRKPYNKNFKPDWNPVAGERFEAFNSQIKLSRPYSYIPDLYSKPPKYDIYISGSDQLWNPTQGYCLEPYFLTFVKEKGSVKVSYGTSIGIGDLLPKEKRLFAKWLKSYDRISVREIQAQRLLSTITGREIERVPDPTFLLERDEWLSIGRKPVGEEYVLVFSLGRQKEILNKAVEIAGELGLKVKVIDQNFPSKDIHPLVEIEAEVGPCEWIGLIREAKLVLTDSFHCTVFSLITNTNNFYTRVGKEDLRGSRIEDLLGIYNLQDHIVSSMDELPSTSCLAESSLDYVKINETMRKEQRIGRDFIDKILKIEK